MVERAFDQSLWAGLAVLFEQVLFEAAGVDADADRAAVGARSGNGRVTIDGDVIRINPRSFFFRGRIVITDTPDRGRNCVREGTYEFRATNQRRYWRLQDFEACDGLADYVDIYF